jgi:hypothetical protein
MFSNAGITPNYKEGKIRHDVMGGGGGRGVTERNLKLASNFIKARNNISS